MNLLRKAKGIRKNLFGSTGEFERFEYKLDKNSNPLSSAWAAHYVIYSKFVKYADNTPTLDICCGAGPGTRLIPEKLSVPVMGIDYSKKAIKYSKRNNTDKNTRYFCLDLYNELDKLSDNY